MTTQLIGDLMMNFRRTLLAILESLIAIQLDRRSEEWDELSERLFDILILGPLRDLSQVRVDARYGEWPKNAGSTFGIGVEVCSTEVPVWVGTIRKWEDEGGAREIEWAERLLAIPGVRFIFREFNHPEAPPASLEALDFVAGEVIEGTSELPARSRVCARVVDCKFFVSQ